MSYLGTSPGLGPGRVSDPDLIDAWLRDLGRQLAPRYAPDRTYQEPPPVGRAILRACAAWGRGALANADLIAADICKESAGLQSAIWRAKRNPSGLGAVNDNPEGGAIDFTRGADGNPLPDEVAVERGVEATAAHWLNYFIGEGAWSPFDPRTPVLREKRYLGVARQLSDLDGRWAWPGVGYGASVGLLGNGLVAYAGAGGGTMPQGAEIPGFVWYPAEPDHYDAGRSTLIRGGAQHYSAGIDSRAWLTRTSRPPVSAHLLVKHTPTLEDRGWQLVRLADTAWATAQANGYVVAIEYEHMDGQAIPDIAYEVLGQTWIEVAAAVEAQRLGAIPLPQGVQGHKVWVGNPALTCPDGIDMPRLWATIGRRLTQEELRFPNGQRLIGGFLAYWRERDGQRSLGLPTSPEVDLADPLSPAHPDNPLPGKRRVQRFERGVLIWLPELPHGWQVQALDIRSELFARALAL